MSLQLADLFNLIPDVKLLHFVLDLRRMDLRETFSCEVFQALFGYCDEIDIVKSNKTYINKIFNNVLLENVKIEQNQSKIRQNPTTSSP